MTAILVRLVTNAVFSLLAAAAVPCVRPLSVTTQIVAYIWGYHVVSFIWPKSAVKWP